MSTTVGNGLTVDGTVKASQATQAGEAVVLGDDCLIPASLLPNTGGKTWEQIPYNSTLVIGDVYMAIIPCGMTIFVAYVKSTEQYVYFPGNSSSYLRFTNNVADRLQVGGSTFAVASATIRLYHLVE